ncbi:hypothetical protein [uncultured Roseobacter sp.]|uniref:hypothetical protein n=1 Tax=uncultured Roseobacter sp. TaxID=114847 RepID=UPI002638D4A1|nr:hypothetical protein [uncultured Roseobacter sp.]
MKPNFALSLSFDGIRLLHRSGEEWRLIGEVSPEAEDLGAKLAVLRKTATAMAPDGLRCKLVIPNEQIRYLRVSTPGLDLADRRDAARDALAGATPYALDDLAFDVIAEGDVTDVAAVALETLQEAEEFAVEHRFHPVSFVAIPEPQTYAGEPYFGPTRTARELLTPGQTVEPDTTAIIIVGDTETPTGPVAEELPGMPPVAEPAADPRPETPTFKSARQAEAERETSLQDALQSLKATEPKVADVTAPDLPPREVTTEVAAFSSRRSAPDPAPLTYETGSAPVVLGFAEPAEPFVPKPSAAPKARSVRAPLPATAPVTTKPASEADRLTVFGARDAQESTPQKRGIPLGLAAVLVLAIAGIGTWSFGSLRDRIAGGPGGEASEITAIEVSPPIQPSASLLDPETSDARELALLDPGLTDEDAAVLDALRAPLAADPAPEQSPEDLRASYAVTGIWPQAPDVPAPPPLVDIEDLYVTSIDPIEPAFDAVALPPVTAFARDVAPDAPISPAAAGTTFALDDRGLVVPTAQGTLSPDGVKIFAGAPPVRPGSFPSRAATATELDPVQTALAAFRPQTRPADLIETAERATLDGLTRSELAELRPPARPAPPLAPSSAATASLVPLEEGAAPLQEQGSERIVASNKDLALAASLRPDARPSNFGQIVERAQRTAASAAAVGAASIAPRAVAPSIPSSASVTREATVRNAINLRKVNLIGVYGTPSNRRALVRLSNGRYKKVQVGDRIDGGRISAIGEGELRYQKRGRNLVLKMPKG